MSVPRVLILLSALRIVQSPNCGAGRYDSLGTCLTCGESWYCPGDDQTRQCPGGFYCSAGVSLPTKCPGGYYCPIGSGSAIACSAGTYCPAGSSNPIPCPGGYYCPASSSSGTANPCPAGYYCPSGSGAAPAASRQCTTLSPSLANSALLSSRYCPAASSSSSGSTCRTQLLHQPSRKDMFFVSTGYVVAWRRLLRFEWKSE